MPHRRMRAVLSQHTKVMAGAAPFRLRDAPASRPALHGPGSGAERYPRLVQGCVSEAVFVRGERSEVLAQLVEMLAMVQGIERGLVPAQREVVLPQPPGAFMQARMLDVPCCLNRVRGMRQVDQASHLGDEHA